MLLLPVKVIGNFIAAMINQNLYIRQSGIIDANKLDFPIMVVGAGGIGGWTTLALAKMGCQDITVCDFDTVEEHNLGSQIFDHSDIGELKVEALKNNVQSFTEAFINPVGLKIDQNFNLAEYKVIISAVDNMQTRSDIYLLAVGSGARYLIDGRMAGNEIQIYTVDLIDPAALLQYRETLFSDDQASQVPCSERAVVYNVFVVAGLITDIVAKIANGETPPRELSVDLKNFTLFGGLV